MESSYCSILASLLASNTIHHSSADSEIDIVALVKETVCCYGFFVITVGVEKISSFPPVPPATISFDKEHAFTGHSF